MSEMLRIDNYTPEQSAERQRLIRLVEKEKRYFLTAVQPYTKALADIESRHNPRYVFVPDATA